MQYEVSAEVPRRGHAALVCSGAGRMFAFEECDHKESGPDPLVNKKHVLTEFAWIKTVGPSVLPPRTGLLEAVN